MGKTLDNLYTSRPSTEQTANFYLDVKEKFIKVDEPEFGDIIVFTVFGLPCHIGLYVDGIRFFHSRRGVNATLEKLSIWKKRVVGYYRWP